MKPEIPLGPGLAGPQKGPKGPFSSNLESSDQGVLTYGFSRKFGGDTYDFGMRGALVRKTKEELGIPEEEPLPSPWTVEIEPTLICNADCHFCSYREARRRYKEPRKGVELKKGEGAGEPCLPKDLVKSLLGELKKGGTTKGIFWSGGGEPLAWQHITEAILTAAEFSDVAIQTNGILLKKLTQDPEYLSAVRLLSISVVGHNRDIHRQIMQVDSFSKVIDNIREVQRLRDRHGMDLVLNTKILVDQINYLFLPDIVQFYRDELEVDVIGIRLVQDYNYGGEGPRANSVELTPWQKKRLLQLIFMQHSNDQTLVQFAQAVVGQMREPEFTRSCYNAVDGHFAVVDVEGNVFLGNPEIGDSRFSIGNLYERSWSEVWKSQRHFEIQGLMNKMQRKGECAIALCRHVRANHGTEQYLKGKLGLSTYEEVMENLGAFL